MEYNNHTVKSIENSTLVAVEWQLGNFCNFKCPYCFDNANLGTWFPPTVDNTLIQNVTHLYNELRTAYPKKHIRWTLSGGEPTAQKKFAELITVLDSYENSQVMLVTNGSRPIAWWKKNIKYLPHIILSHHPESNVNHNIELINLFAKHKTQISVNIMIGDQNFKQAISAYKSYSFTTNIQYSKINLKFNRIRPTTRNTAFKKLSLEQHAEIDSLINNNSNLKTYPPVSDKKMYWAPRVVYDNKNERFDHFKDFSKYEGNWIGYECYAHNHAINIGYNGDIGSLPCLHRFREDISIFATNFKNDFKLQTTPIICDRASRDCKCIASLESPKVLKIN